MSASEPASVRRRKVFYIPGFDPMPARRYRELYRVESDIQARISGYRIAQKPHPGSGFMWIVNTRIDDSVTRTDMRVLPWADIVRKSMTPGILATYGLLVRTAWTYVASGALRRLMWLRKGPIIAALYPFGALILQLVVALVFASSVSALNGRVLADFGAILGPWLPPVVSALPVWPILGGLIDWAIYLGAALVVLGFFRSRDGSIFAYYLLHDYAFTARLKGENPPELEERMARFADAIAEAMASDADEVLVVGHSSGAHIAVSVVADMIRQGKVPANGPTLGLLTLGQVIPMVSFLPRATRLRADLNFLSTSEDLTWIDISAPADGCSFALCDPVAVSGVAPRVKRWPLVLSAAFSQTLSKEMWSGLRWRFFRLHFQYLCAFDVPGQYDYFQITAGPLTLGARFADRKPSRSRIDVAASRYTSVAA